MSIRVLVLVPTRELGVQVYQVTKQLAQFTTVEVGLSVGGLELKVQVRQILIFIVSYLNVFVFIFRNQFYVKIQILL